MSFRDIIASDISAAFFGPEGFAERHRVDGVEVDAVIDSSDLQRRRAVRVYSAETAGLQRGRLLLFVPAAQIGPRPAAGRLVDLDGRKYRVAECSDEAGVYALELEATGP